MRPNIIFIVLDCVRYDHLGCYGNSGIKTPAIDSLAREGVLFKNAYSHCSMTGPSHLTIFTSTLPITHRLRLNGSAAEIEVPTMAEILKDNGYATAAFVGAYVLNKRFKFDRGFLFYDDAMTKKPFEDWVLKLFGYSKKWADTRVNKFSRNADRVTGSAITWLKRISFRSPFFMWLHYFDAHDQFRLPQPLHYYYFRKRDYRKSIEYIDSQIGMLVRFLKKKDLFRNTLFIITADHGEVLNEYEFMGKPYRGHAALAYNVALRVPLIFSGNGVMQNKAVDQTFRHVDMLPTMLSLAEIPLQKYRHFEGESLARYCLEDAIPEKGLDVYAETIQPTAKGLPEWRVLVRGKWKYIFMPQSKEEFLYDLERDSAEKTNIIHANPEVAAEMKMTLLKMMEKDKGSTEGSRDSEVKGALKALGYL